MREIRLSVQAVAHSHFKAVDHNSIIINKEFDGNIKLKRTKATQICKNVVAQAMKEELKETMTKFPAYSIQIDEATDISTNKLLAIIIRYAK